MRVLVMIPAVALILTAIAWDANRAAGAAETVAARSLGSPEMDAARQSAQAAIMDLGRSLREPLMEKMASEGALGSIEFCHANAAAIAAMVAERRGVAVGRTGVRIRNPDNAASGWRDAVLRQFAARAAAGQSVAELSHAEVDPGGTVLRFAKAIPTEAGCLACHGPALSPPVAAAIKARYPEDAATGFTEGQLRGLIWAEVPLAQPAAAADDPRVVVPLTGPQSLRLRAEMRVHLEAVQAIIAALAVDDWVAVADLAQTQARGRRHAAPGAPGAEFRQQLPDGWRNFGRPMHIDFGLLVDEARGAMRKDAALEILGRATSRCTACHATFRITAATRL